MLFSGPPSMYNSSHTPVAAVDSGQLLDIAEVPLKRRTSIMFLGLAYDRCPIKFILPEFVSDLGERGVLCVGNG